MDESKTPVLVGVAQYVNREKTKKQLEPIDMMADVVRMAAKDASITDLKKIDTLYIVNCLSKTLQNPIGDLSEKLGINPSESGYTWIGASAPQWFINRSAKRIYAGESELALITGAEAFYYHKEQKPFAGLGGGLASYLIDSNFSYAGDLRYPLTSLETQYGLVVPVSLYSLFENALRAHRKQTIPEHINELSSFCAQMSDIASRNDYSWFKEPKTANQIAAVTKQNRRVVFPYTKLMCSIMNVNQSAAVIMTSLKKAKEMGAPQDKIIFLRGYGEAEDVWHVTERPELWSSPSVADAVDMALKTNDLSLNEVNHLDLYSCFPSPPRMTMETLNIQHDDPRHVTVTGGMPYFGGPGNNYSLHAICLMADILRKNPDDFGLVQSLSWFSHKHMVGLYSASPGKTQWKPIETNGKSNEYKPVKVIEKANGRAVVESYNITYDKEGQPVDSIIIGRLDNKDRFISRALPDSGVYEQMANEEPIGKSGKVKFDDKTSFNWFSFK